MPFGTSADNFRDLESMPVRSIITSPANGATGVTTTATLGWSATNATSYDVSFGSTNPPLLKMAMALPLLAMPIELDVDPRWRDDSLGWAEWTFGTRFMETNKAWYLDASGNTYRPLTATARQRLMRSARARPKRGASRPSTA